MAGAMIDTKRQMLEWLDTNRACGDGIDWAQENCSSLDDVWRTARPNWLIWVATRSGVLTDRELRLFGCWCVRQVWHLLDDDRSKSAVEVAERYAVGIASTEELARAAADAARAASDAAARADASAARAAAAAARASSAAASAAVAAYAAAAAADAAYAASASVAVAAYAASAASAAAAAASAAASYAAAARSAEWATACAAANEAQAEYLRKHTTPAW